MPQPRLKFVLASEPFLLGLAANALALPKEEPPAHHWPLWLRILAVIGAVIFVVIVARSVRSGSGGQGPGAAQGP